MRGNLIIKQQSIRQLICFSWPISSGRVWSSSRAKLIRSKCVYLNLNLNLSSHLIPSTHLLLSFRVCEQSEALTKRKT